MVEKKMKKKNLQILIIINQIFMQDLSISATVHCYQQSSVPKTK